jgi:hypothetical protein
MIQTQAQTQPAGALLYFRQRALSPPMARPGAAKVKVPADLPQQVEAYLQEHPTERWDVAVAAIVKKARTK